MSHRQLLVQTLGLDNLFKEKKSEETDKELLRIYSLDKTQKTRIPEILLDMLIGIATNDSNSSVVEPILTLFDVPEAHRDVMPALIQLYNKNDSKLTKAATAVEEFIAQN